MQKKLDKFFLEKNMPKPASEEKKSLKKAINENGFFIHMDSVEEMNIDYVEDYLGKLDDEVKTRAKMPKDRENILVFKGLASQAYPKGKKSRNGYKYLHSGMNFKNYRKNPIVLLQHDTEKPIGYALSLNVTEGVGLEILYFVDFGTKAAKEHEHEIRNGYIGMLSTGAISNNWGIENSKTGEIMTRGEARDAGIDIWDVMTGRSSDYVLVVTESELIENSQVTIGSNPDAMATTQNSLGRFFKNEFEKMKEEDGFSEKEEKKNEVNQKTDTVEPDNAKTGNHEEDSATPIDSDQFTISEDDFQKIKELQDALERNQNSTSADIIALKDNFANLTNIVVGLASENKLLRKRLDSIPALGAMKLTNQLGAKKENRLTSALKKLAH